jgi:hypothetical protein
MTSISWFEKLTGFRELNPQNVYANISRVDNTLVSKVNNKKLIFGNLEIISLEDLRKRNNLNTATTIHSIKVSEVIGNVLEMHTDTNNANALFQAASQFNLLEMISPETTPEKGVSIYENDQTQGPACAIACGSGTIYRNYFVPLKGEIGQTKENQIDCLNEIGLFFQNTNEALWTMKNGYALLNEKGLLQINKKLAHLSNHEYNTLQGKLKVGIQWNTEVTHKDVGHIVSQIYCSALPIGYSEIDDYYAENFAKLILTATYEATLYTALENYYKTNCNLVYLTLVGGGVFANKIEWIKEAIIKAIDKFKYYPLDVRIISYCNSKKDVVEICNRFA